MRQGLRNRIFAPPFQLAVIPIPAGILIPGSVNLSDRTIKLNGRAVHIEVSGIFLLYRIFFPQIFSRVSECGIECFTGQQIFFRNFSVGALYPAEASVK